MSDDTEKYEAFVRIGNLIEADLLAAFLEDGDITFKLIKSAQTMAPILQASQAPTVFYVLKEDLPRAKTLLEAYREAMASETIEDEASGTDSDSSE